MRSVIASWLRAFLQYTNLHAFGVALTISVLLHGITLSSEFSTAPPKKRVRDRGLDVILVNSRSATKPRIEETQALAQHNLDGGGNVDPNQKRRVASFLPPSQREQQGEQLLELQERTEALEAKRRELIAQNSRAPATRAQEKDAPEVPRAPTDGMDLAEAARAMVRLEGEIAKNTEAYNSRPRKTFIGARTQEYRFAQYIEDWRQKVERWGTLNYPEAARGKLYGTLALTVTLDRDGKVLEVTIDRPSPHKVLDEAARRIVYMAAPYPPFPPAIARDTDQLVISRVWSFTDRVETK
ncbi:MAG: TonB family protein [Zoogloeaceae bacterium]|jgi:protein TonB|nr:TonB family protein [Zoogloeaceae bacterium]